MASRRFRVLVVEDNAVFRRGLARLFPPNQFEVSQAGDGQQAVDLIGSQSIDLVICDYRMPKLDGLGVLKHMRERHQQTPFILVTAHYTEELAADAKKQGALAVLEKPLDLARLKRPCEEALWGTSNESPHQGAKDGIGEH